MARILVFDSGVGGLSVLAALQKNLKPRENGHQWLFCSDNAFFPYGTKPEAELVDRVVTVLTHLQQRHQPDVIVIACNTASTVALPAVRQQIAVPVIGVVPAIKPAAALSQSRVIGLLATPGTIARPYTEALIRDFAADCTVVRVGSSELVWMAEDYLRSGMVDHARLYNILTPLRDAIHHQKLDTVVLACTHFPLLIEALHEQLPEIVHWVDSGDAIARRVDWCLEQLSPTLETTPPAITVSGHVALFTRKDAEVYKLQQALVHFRLQIIEEVMLDIPSRSGE